MNTFSDIVKIIKYQLILKRSDGKEFIDKNKKKYSLIRIRVQNNKGSRYYINQISYLDIETLRKNKIAKGTKCKIDIICIPSSTRRKQDHNKYIKTIKIID